MYLSICSMVFSDMHVHVHDHALPYILYVITSSSRSKASTAASCMERKYRLLQ